jgi:hypothetical protein
VVGMRHPAQPAASSTSTISRRGIGHSPLTQPHYSKIPRNHPTCASQNPARQVRVIARDSIPRFEAVRSVVRRKAKLWIIRMGLHVRSCLFGHSEDVGSRIPSDVRVVRGILGAEWVGGSWGLYDVSLGSSRLSKLKRRHPECGILPKSVSAPIIVREILSLPPIAMGDRADLYVYMQCKLLNAAKSEARLIEVPNRA